MHRSIPAAPMPTTPPGANPRVLAFFSFLDGTFPGVGALKLQNARGGDEGRGQMSRPPGSYVPNQHCSSFHLLHNSANF